MTTRIVSHGNETFIIGIISNAPGAIIQPLQNIIDEWLEVQGSTEYFTGEHYNKGKGRKALNLKLKIIRKKH